MENDGKYYTPTIEEFYVGFEYEVKKEESWFRCFYSQGSLVDIYYKYNDDLDSIDFEVDTIRVKYLDQEDIESLGWRFEKKHAGLEEFQFTTDELSLDYNLESHYLRIAWYGDGDITRFSGTIKNKSELIKLLKQL